jgi:hypothetical protein
MAVIILAPGPMELGLNREAYDATVQELEGLGHTVTVKPPDEYRSLPGAEAVAHTLAVYLFEFVDQHVIDAIVGVLVYRLTAPRLRGQRTRRAVIYGPDKRVIHAFELPTTETDEQDN